MGDHPYGSVSNTLTGQYQRTATFTMPNENVSARAMSKSAGVSTGGDDGGGGGGAAILLVAAQPWPVWWVTACTAMFPSSS